MLFCYDCYLKDGGDPKKWERINFDPKTTRECERCHAKGPYIKGVLPPVKKTRVPSLTGWEPECGKRDRPEHIWRRLMEHGY